MILLQQVFNLVWLSITSVNPRVIICSKLSHQQKDGRKFRLINSNTLLYFHAFKHFMHFVDTVYVIYSFWYCALVSHNRAGHSIVAHSKCYMMHSIQLHHIKSCVVRMHTPITRWKSKCFVRFENSCSFNVPLAILLSKEMHGISNLITRSRCIYQL